MKMVSNELITRPGFAKTAAARNKLKTTGLIVPAMSNIRNV